MEPLTQVVEHLTGYVSLCANVAVEAGRNRMRAIVELPNAMSVTAIPNNVAQSGFSTTNCM